MADYSIRIENIDQIRRAFKKSPEKMAKFVNEAIKKSMFLVQRETILNVHPARGINIITGGLEAATEQPPVFTPLKGVYDVNIDYAIYVHEGTRFMRGRPFLANALESESKAVNDLFKEAVDNVGKELAKESQ